MSAKPKTCDDCAFVGPMAYVRDERRCDFLLHQQAPDWVSDALNASKLNLHYGPNSRAEDCRAFQPYEDGEPA